MHSAVRVCMIEPATCMLVDHGLICQQNDRQSDCDQILLLRKSTTIGCLQVYPATAPQGCQHRQQPAKLSAMSGEVCPDNALTSSPLAAHPTFASLSMNSSPPAVRMGTPIS
jgi:hypothetical protein